MKNNNKINFFVKKNSSFFFFFIPLLIIVLVSAGVVIATGWYSVDYKISEELAKGLQSEFGKYWTRFYEQLGNTELVVIILVYIAIILETLFLTKINQKKQGFKKNYWVVDTYYIIIFIGWVGFNLINIILIPNTDYGFGKGIDRTLLDDIKYQLTGAIIAFTLQTMLLVLGFYYVRYHLVKKQRILVEQFWLKAVKGLSYVIITYVVIVVLKGTTSRTYYYNAIFGDLISTRPDLLEAYKNSGFQYGYGADHASNIPWELQYPWWKPSLNLVDSNAYMPRFKLPWEYAFPSGHVNATYCTATGILLFLKNKNNDKVNWKIKVLFIFWLAHVLSMNFSLVVERFHWISDTAFTFVFSTLMILVIHFSVNKIFAKKIK
ncbi:phosphatase PAP2 family protein [Spiroplasma platyhelix]|uniref:Phosphatase PAP2 family protein n=1 Tax=Spiroplasma platyhelix PALS-1 TaxID=1276218 RepID=A0A846U1K3_9MOLU|nr:phosphatase PAP2 family protein [Spiroplasma platyhelix]MBE4704314.1 hypothetical protein [Spiroplasma platyhelix PALS-1]NKE38686.1 phosphatase PAP2 family protein [Spiroplasma platyhelix PALS-1]UJB28898.1 hypothetical protein SPLAT_v1c01310 [Spiroplasma platyhelix PALS-1]